MTVNVMLPVEIERLARASGALPPPRIGRHEMSDMLMPAPPNLDEVEGLDPGMAGCIRALCERRMELIPGRRDTVEAISHVYGRARSRHAYVGTVILSLLEGVGRKMGGRSRVVIRDELESLGVPAVSELGRQFGRPSVPSRFLAVFAIYEAEKEMGEPLPDIDAELLAAGLTRG